MSDEKTAVDINKEVLELTKQVLEINKKNHELNLDASMRTLALRYADQKMMAARYETDSQDNVFNGLVEEEYQKLKKQFS